MRILDSDGKTVGAGFVVSGDGLVATCAHVVVDAGAGPGGHLAVTFEGNPTTGSRTAHVLPEFWREPLERDIAVLQVDGPLPDGVTPAPLGPSKAATQHAVFALGFPAITRSPNSQEEENSRPLSLAADGVVVAVLQRMPPPSVAEGAHPVLQLRSSEITAGFSGAPLLDVDRARVIGIVDSMLAPDDAGKHRDAAFATPSETLVGVCPALKVSSVCPFQGLAAFTEAQERYFAGRERVTERLLDSLRKEPRWLLVLGPSGSGKSSVVHAGLLPALRRGALPGSDQWEFIVSRPANSPFAQLECAGLSGATASLTEAVDAFLRHKPAAERLLVLLDQFEDLIVACTPGVRQAFLAELIRLLNGSQRVSVLVVMQNDFYGRLGVEVPALLELLEESVRNVPQTLQPEDVEAIVRRPTSAVGLLIEDALLTAIQDDILATAQPAEAGAARVRATMLPLLQFALTQVWRRDHLVGELTVHTYRKVGGLSGALVQWAEAAFAELRVGRLDSTARRLLLALVRLGNSAEGIPDSRRRRARAALWAEAGDPEAVDLVIDQLSRARLRVIDGAKATATVEIIHDALIREWGRFQDWLREDYGFLAWRQQTGPRLSAWIDSGSSVTKRDKDLLLRGKELLSAEAWLASDRNWAFTDDERQFITLSTRRQRTVRFVLFAAAAVVIGVLTGAVLYINAQKQAAVLSREELAKRSAVSWFRIGHTALENDRDVLTAFLSACRALAVAPDNDPQRATYFARALALVASTPKAVMRFGPVGRAAIDSEHHVVVLQRLEGTIEAWNSLTGSRLPGPVDHLMIHGGLLYPEAPVIRPDGRYAAIVTPNREFVGDLRLLVWDLASGKAAIDEPADLVFTPTFGPDGWVSHQQRTGLRLWRLGSPNPQPRDIPSAISLVPSRAPKPLVALIDGGLRFLDPSSPTASSGPFLTGEVVSWSGWTSDGRLLVVTRRDSRFQGHWCSSSGCVPSNAAVLSIDPDRVGLHVGPCGDVFGSGFILDKSGTEAPIVSAQDVSGGCVVDNTVVVVSKTSSGQWWTFQSILEYAKDDRRNWVEEFQRRIPGGAIAIDWEKQGEELTTLSASGLLLSWPAIVRSPYRKLFDLAPSEDAQEMWPAFDRLGELLAIGRVDHKGVNVEVYSLGTHKALSKSRVSFSAANAPARVRDDPRFIHGQLRTLRFSANAKKLVVGIQDGAGSELTVIEPRTGAVVTSHRFVDGSLEDGAVGDRALSAVFDNSVAEQISLESAARVVKRCTLPPTHHVGGFAGQGDLVILRRSDGIELWSLAECRSIASVPVGGGDAGTDWLVNLLLERADEVRGGVGKIVARFGEDEAVIGAESGVLTVSHGTVRLQLPKPPDGTRYIPIAVSRDLRRVAVRGAGVQLFDLETGLAIGWSSSLPVVGEDWSTSQATHSVWGAAFAADSQSFMLLQPDQLSASYLGPARLAAATWMRDIDVGVTGLRIDESGLTHSPTNALEQMRGFRATLESASKKGDEAAQALLRMLDMN